MKRLLSPDPGGGGSGDTPPAPGPSNPSPPAAPAAPTPPPAATTVVHATKSEREVHLEKELEEERGRHGKTAEEKKQREVRIAELEDELHRLKSPQPAKGKKSILDMSEFFED